MFFIVFVSDTNEIASLVLQALCAGYFYQSAKRAHSHVFRHQNQSLFGVGCVLRKSEICKFQQNIK
jgi:hypothetical protein